MTSSHPTPAPCQWLSRLAAALDRRSAPRLALLFLGAVLARGRRTVTAWIRAAKLSGQYQPCYVAVAAAGKRADRIARRLLTEVVRPLLKGGMLRRPRLGPDLPWNWWIGKDFEPPVRFGFSTTRVRHTEA